MINPPDEVLERTQAAQAQAESEDHVAYYSGHEKRSAKIFGKEIRPKVFGKLTKMS